MPDPAANGHKSLVLVAEDAATVAEPQQTGATFADITPTAGERKPVIPEQWQKGNARATLNRHLGIHWHKSKYHGLRGPVYLLRTLWFAVRGAGRLSRRLVIWWHATNLWALESMAVAAGRPGHGDAMRAHTEGKKTRAKRGQILAVCLVLTAGMVIAGVIFVPWWGWALVLTAAVPLLARHGKPAGKPVIGRAVVAPQFEALTQPLITRALAATGIGEIARWLKDHEIEFVTPVTRDGPGWRVALNLPYGVTVSEVLERRDKFASGLRRPVGCVWPEGDEIHEGRLVLYVCDQPLRQMRQPSWSLAKAGRADVFAAFPFGTDQRGRVVSFSLMFANLLIGSIPRMGKTVAMRIALLAAALDPTVEMRVFELKGTGDLSPLAKVAHAYGSGADDETIAACLDSLRQLHDVELIRRAKVIRGLPKDRCPDSKVTPELAADRSLGLQPIVFGLDECQEAFSHEEWGPLFEKYATGVIKRGPALGIMLVLATQKPDKKSLPTSVSSNVAMRFCLRVMDWQANDMVLGTGAYRRGIAATLLAMEDKGCGYLIGAADAHQVVRTFSVNTERADQIAGRARATRQAAGRLTGYALGEGDENVNRDFAADVLFVFGSMERNLWTETVAARLAELIPDVYADITQAAVASQLRKRGVEVKKVRQSGEQGSRAGVERAALEATAQQAVTTDV